ncbi:hypothetical protein [Acidisoma sp. S159]|uniref:hypothetical protein n=1 Tax=Acidisoma sp. S159 TaxID=1747225 RepID=UPI00131DDB9D|nr:hypothetical protein [Acidisoma sp. S159]
MINLAAPGDADAIDELLLNRVDDGNADRRDAHFHACLRDFTSEQRSDTACDMRCYDAISCAPILVSRSFHSELP